MSNVIKFPAKEARDRKIVHARFRCEPDRPKPVELTRGPDAARKAPKPPMSPPDDPSAA